MDYLVSVTVQMDKLYKVHTDRNDEYEARDLAEEMACEEYGHDPDFGSAEAWDVMPVNNK